MEVSKTLDLVVSGGLRLKQGKMLCCSYLSRCCRSAGVTEKTEQLQVRWSLKEWLPWPSNSKGDFKQCLVCKRSEEEKRYNQR